MKNSADLLPFEELELLPAEQGWGKWRGLPGYADTTVERWATEPSQIWVAGLYGPRQIEATKVERWKFRKYQHEGNRFGPMFPEDKRGFIYTSGDYPHMRDYCLVAPESKASIDNVCAETREDLCKYVSAKLTAELKAHNMAGQLIRGKRKVYQ
ncbi:hypothetical protein DNI29_04555 [Hymenobacter sediminis]|uniref:hypothetical protein n=1 Tax=Hymenobacter sediminis TaxID=2218621 RepID=UPI000DA6D1CC|nr:hypothetical protein [Hymenobacter sediminis]RPD50073.1 hypothetical protein DNI29_04555 [Hymenobacter sediminis]